MPASDAAIARNARKWGIRLKESALELGHVTEDEFAQWVVPLDAQLNHPHSLDA